MRLLGIVILSTILCVFCSQVAQAEDLQSDRIGTQELISIARTWQQSGLKPDFETDWSPKTLFQYVGKGDEIAMLKTTDGGTIFHLPQEGTGYERVFGVTQVKTHQNIPHLKIPGGSTEPNGRS